MLTLLFVLVGALAFLQLAACARAPNSNVRPFAGNGLKDLSVSIGALSSLRTLRVSGNALAALPKETASLPLLREVHVGGNSGLDREGVEEALRRRPDITIVWEDNGKNTDDQGAGSSTSR